MSDRLEKLKPSRLKRELIPFIIIGTITFASFIYFSYQDSTGSIAYSPEAPYINIEVSSEITNYSQQCFLIISPISYEFVKSGWANRHLAADIRKRDSDGGFSFELYQSENLFQIRIRCVFANVLFIFDSFLELKTRHFTYIIILADINFIDIYSHCH